MASMFTNLFTNAGSPSRALKDEIIEAARAAIREELTAFRNEASAKTISPPMGLMIRSFNMAGRAVSSVRYLYPDIIARQHWAMQGVTCLCVVLVAEKMVVYKLHKRAYKIIAWCTPGQWFRDRWSQPKIVVDNSNLSVTNILESTRDGSTEAPMTSPKCQARICKMRDNTLYVIGLASRYDDEFLMTADHCVGGDGTEEQFLVGRQGMISLKDKERVVLAPDATAISLTPKEWSTVGVTVASQGEIPQNGTTVSIVGPESKGTTGTIRHDPNVFGRVIYESTTKPGYSGGAYTAGPRVVAMHQMGGKHNSGICSSYLAMLLRLHKGVVHESSEQWLQSQFQAGSTVHWSHADPGNVDVMIGGKFSRVTSEAMTSAFGVEWSTHHTLHRSQKPRYYDVEDLESANADIPAETPTSGEANGSTLPGASNQQESNQDLDQSNTRGAITAYMKLSPKQRATFQRSLKLRIEPRQTSSGQASVGNAPTN